MSRIISIDPVTRIEGHARISIFLDEAGQVKDAQLHVTQLRGFEKLAQGRPFREMPALTARICGICPVSHLLASAKACDELLGVKIPETAVMLRRLVNYAQMVQSHALSFFYLSAPDLLLGMDAPVAERNILGLAHSAPDLARDGIRLRQFGQQLIEGLGGKRIHNAWVIGGGLTEALKTEVQAEVLAKIPEMLAIIEKTIQQFRAILPHFSAEIESFANFPTMYMGLISPEDTLEYYDGQLHLVDSNGQTVSTIEGKAYAESIGEAVESFSYLKSPYYIPMAYPDGIYRVGALARLQLVKHCGTPLADAELARFRSIPAKERQSSFYYHYARLIEILHGLERIDELLQAPEILDKDVCVYAEPVNREGIGIIEAPRGTLIHHYKIDDYGLITDMNLIVSTGHNVLAMNRGIKQAAEKFVDAGKLQEGMLNRLEAVIRAFDPCLSCATHAVGQMPLRIQLIAPDGSLIEVNSAMTLIIGYGNPLRTDDAIGSIIADAIGGMSLEQLSPELAEPISQADFLVLIDASHGENPGQIRLEKIEAQGSKTITHQSKPADLLQMARELYGSAPSALLIAITGANFDFGDTLSPQLQNMLPELIRQIQVIIQSHDKT